MSYVFLLNGKYWDTIAVPLDFGDVRIELPLRDGAGPVTVALFREATYESNTPSPTRTYYVAEVPEGIFAEVVWPEVTMLDRAKHHINNANEAVAALKMPVGKKLCKLKLRQEPSDKPRFIVFSPGKVIRLTSSYCEEVGTLISFLDVTHEVEGKLDDVAKEVWGA